MKAQNRLLIFGFAPSDFFQICRSCAYSVRATRVFSNTLCFEIPADFWYQNSK
jgi:hypothetical protein